MSFSSQKSLEKFLFHAPLQCSPFFFFFSIISLKKKLYGMREIYWQKGGKKRNEKDGAYRKGDLLTKPLLFRLVFHCLYSV